MFETIYRGLADLYGLDLADYLSGYQCATDEMDANYLGTNLFTGLGFWALISALVVIVLYYYVINHPKFNKWWSWLIMLGGTFIGNLIYGTTLTLNKLYDGHIDSCLIDGSRGGIADYNCWMLGVSNGLVAIGFFLIFTISLKWWSRNASRSPF